MERHSRRKREHTGRRGHAIVETALLAPWIFFLFVGVLDFGFYAYAAISTENAARVAALYTSSTGTLARDAHGACQYVVNEMRALPNVGQGTSCPSSCTGACTAGPLTVQAQALDGLSGRPLGVDGAPASQVTVTYRTISRIPIPGLLPMQLNMTRSVQMRIVEQ
jgi:Flp pilus assembly protein TadG